MILSHFSEEPLILDVSRTYKPVMDGPVQFKPTGLWLSDESDHGWKQWCEAEQFRTETLKYRTDFKLKNSDRILRLGSADKLKAFTEQFRANLPIIGMSSIWIDWDRVMKEFGGVVITPYIWECRLAPGFSWYYGWDCASGCVWDLSLLEVING